MSHQWELVEEANCVVVTWGATFDIDEFMEFYTAFMADPGFRPGVNRLYDMRATRLAMTAQDLAELTGRLQMSEDRQGRRMAVFLVEDDLSFGVVRQLIVTASPLAVDYHVTRSAAEARARLGLPPGYALPGDR